MSSIYTYHVPTIIGTCCENVVSNAIKQHELLKQCGFNLDIPTKTLILERNNKVAALQALSDNEYHKLVRAAIEAAGHEVTLKDAKLKDQKEKTAPIPRGVWAGIGLIAGFGLLLIPLFLPALPWLAMAGMVAFSAILTIGIGFPFYRQAFYALKAGQWTMDTLFSISTLVILAVSLGALFFPALPLMMEAGLLIFGFRHLGITIAELFKARLSNVKKLQDDVPRTVQIKRDGEVEETLAEFICAGDELILSSGDLVPVDGVFESGRGLVSNVYKTGSNTPEDIVLGEECSQGTKLEHVLSPLRFRATKSAEQSFLVREDHAILQAKLKQKPNETGLHQVLKWFVPTVLAIAVLSAIAIGIALGSWILAIQCMVFILVVACPCTLGLIAPLVTHVGLQKAEEAGVHFRDFEKLEALNDVDCVMFDLNGTLTQGRPYVKNPDDNQTLIQLMAHLERGATHWVAEAIKKAEAPNNSHIGPIEYIEPSSRYGLTVRYQDKTYALGGRTMMEQLQNDNQLEIPPGRTLDVALTLGESATYLVEDGVLLGHVVLVDRLREGARDVVRMLQQSDLDKEVFICTGSDWQTAEDYARALNLNTPIKEHVYAACSSEEKKEHLKRLQAKGHKVLFVGDAGNDGLVISEGDVGIAIDHAAGHEGAQQGASAVLYSPKLYPLIDLFKISKNTVSEIKQNIAFSFVYNALAMLLPMVLIFAAGIAINPAVGAALMMLQTLLIFANVYRYQVSEDTRSEPKPSGPTLDHDRDIISTGNRMGLTYANGHSFDVESRLNTCDDELGHGLDDVELPGLY